MKRNRILSFFLLLVMLTTSIFPLNVGAADTEDIDGAGTINNSAIEISPLSNSVYYSNQEISLKIESPPETIISFSGDSEKVYFAQTMVVWENPDNGQTYYGYCVNPKYAGWKSSDKYNIDIGEFDDDCIVDKGGSGGAGKRVGDKIAGAEQYGWTPTIKQALEGAVVWGYPSRTAAEILGNELSYYPSGVTQEKMDYAAYVATKMAIWTLIHDAYVDVSQWVGHSSAEYPQELIDDMMDAYRFIINKGRFYTAQPEVPITLSHTDPVKNGANWEVTYTVEGTVLEGTQIIVGYNDDMPFANGEKILLMNGSEATKGTGGYAARYLLPVGEKQFKAIFPAPPMPPAYEETREIQIFAQTGNKQLLYAEALKSSRQNLVLAGNAYARKIDPFTVQDKPPGNPPDDPSGDLVIYKLDAVTGDALSGVTFDVYNSKGQRISSGTTGAGGSYKPNIRDENGNIIKDTYWIVERTTNTGYQYTEPLTQSIKVDEENVTYTVTFRNFPSQIVTIIKEDSQTGEPVNGCEYEIMQIDGKGAWRAVATTSGKGMAKWDNVPDGTYLVREVSTVSGYILDPTPQYVTVRNGQAPSLKFLDSKFPGLTITKVDTQTGLPIMTQATFRVEQINGAYSKDVSTSGGKATLTDMPVGSYKIRELSAPDGWVIDETIGTVYLAEGASVQYNHYNLKMPVLTIEKVDGQSGDPVPGTRFEIRKTDGTLYGTVTTGADGTVKVGNMGHELGYLTPGTYTVTEVFVPEPYVLTGEHQDIQLNGGDTKSLFFNNLQMPKIQIEKYDEQTTSRLPDAQFAIYEQHDMSRPVVEGVTDSNGVLNSGFIPPGTYIVQELNPPPGYMFSDKTPQTRTIVANAGDGTITVKYDNVKLPQLTIKKIDAVTGKPIQGVTYRVELTDDTSFQPATLVTNEQGLIVIPGLKAGTYTITEISCPSDYILNTTPQNVMMLGGDEKTVLFENTRKPVLIITKLNGATGKPVPATTFKIEYEAANGGLVPVGTYETDANGQIIIPKVNAGYYVATETKAASGYSLPYNPVTRIFLEPGANAYISDGVSTGTEQIIGDGYSVLSGDDFTPTIGADGQLIYDWPLNSIVIKKTDAITGELLNGAEFELYRADEQVSGVPGTSVGRFKTNNSGIIVIPGLEPGYYVVKEVIPPTNYLLSENNMQNGFLKPDGTSVLEFSFANVPFGSLLVTKTNAKTGKPLLGARFKVTDAEYTVVGNTNGEFETDVNGQFVVPNLKPGAYIVTEIEAPKGFIVDTTPQTISIGKDGKVYKLDFTNQPIGGILITKKDSITKEPLAGAQFQVKDSRGVFQGDTANGLLTTDATGTFLLENLEPGAYVVTEIKAPDGYLLDYNSQTVHVEYGEIKSVDFFNEPKGGLVVKKYDSVTKEPLAEAIFKVTDIQGAAVGTSNGQYRTNESGVFYIHNLPPGGYKVQEIQAPAGYVLDNHVETIQVIDEKMYSLEFFNMPIGGLQIRKQDENTKQPLSGAVFKVTKQNGMLVGDYETDVTGFIHIPKLEQGFYVIEEVSPPPGYANGSSPQTVEVKTYDVAVVTFYNKLLTSLQIKKIDEISGAPLAGAKISVEKQNGERVGEYTTDETGFINIPEVQPGWYVARETKAPEGYILDETPKTVEVKTASPTVVTFTNKPLSGVQIKKINSVTRQPIEGVEFSLSKMNGEKIGSFKTGKDGLIFISELEPGWYSLYEVRSADGYILDKEPRNFEVTYGKPVVIEVENSPVSSILINKTDARTRKPLEGVRFEVSKENGEKVGVYETDISGRILISPLPTGKYTVVETQALKGYELDAKAREVIVNEGKQSVINIENTQKAGLRIKKIDSVTKLPIFNVEFMLFDETGKVVGTYYSDNNGVVDFAGIVSEGRYTLRETRPADGYYHDDIPRTVQFEAGKYTEIVWENIPQMGQVQITKKAATDNEINGLPAGTPLEGAIFELYSYKSGNLVDRFVSGSDGKAVSKPLPLGRYICKEVQAPKYYKLNPKELDIEIEFATQIIKLEYTNESANTGVTIKKTGNLEAMPGDLIKYEIKTVQNTSSVPLTDFFWRDSLPVDAVRLNKIVTGSYNQSLKYKILATTNKGNSLIIADNLSTTQNNVIDCRNAALGLFNDEYVTSFTLVFGNVKAGFCQVQQPQIFVDVLKTLPNGLQFGNKADVGGKYGSEWIGGNSTVVTTIFKNGGKLPKTGY